MGSIPYLTILSGGASPHLATGKPGYDWIAREALIRKVPCVCFDYQGCGHFPIFGRGFDVVGASQRVLAEFHAGVSDGNISPGGVLFCRSLGCWVGAYLASTEPLFAVYFARIAFWGPPSFHAAWKMVAKTKNSLSEFNKKSEPRGLLLAERFWDTLVPLEESASRCPIPHISIGFGTQDLLCSPAFVQYLAAICAGRTLPDGRVDIVPIEGAEHEIRLEDAEGPIGKAYLDFIFSA